MTSTSIYIYGYAPPPPLLRPKPDPELVSMSVIPAEGGIIDVLGQVVVAMITGLTDDGDSCGGMV